MSYKATHHKNTPGYIKTFSIIIIVLNLAPAFALYFGYFGKSFFFPSYLLASVISALVFVILFHLSAYALPHHRYFLTLLLLLKIIAVHIILLYVFTPILDYIMLKISISKLCINAPSWGEIVDLEAMREGCAYLYRSLK